MSQPPNLLLNLPTETLGYITIHLDGLAVYSLYRTCKRAAYLVTQTPSVGKFKLKHNCQIRRFPSLCSNISFLNSFVLVSTSTIYWGLTPSSLLALPSTLRRLKLECAEAYHIFYRHWRPGSFYQHRVVPAVKLTGSAEDVKQVISVKTHFPGLEKLTLLGKHLGVGLALIPLLPPTLLSLSIGANSPVLANPQIYSGGFPPNLTSLTMRENLELRHPELLPPSLTRLDLPSGVIRTMLPPLPDLTHCNVGLAADLRDFSGTLLPKLSVLMVSATASQLGEWLPRLYSSPLSDFYLRGNSPPLAPTYEHLLPRTVTNVGTWGLDSLSLDNIKATSPMKTPTLIGPIANTWMFVYNIGANPVRIADLEAHRDWSSILTNLYLGEPDGMEDFTVGLLPRRLTALGLDHNTTLTNAMLPLLPPGLTFLSLPHNTLIDDSGLLILPKRLETLQLSGSSAMTSRASIAAIPRSITCLTIKYVDQWTDDDLRLLPPHLVTLELRNAKRITDRGISFLPDSLRYISFKNNQNFTVKCFRSLPSNCQSFHNTKNRIIRRRDRALVPRGVHWISAKLKANPATDWRGQFSM